LSEDGDSDNEMDIPELVMPPPAPAPSPRSSNQTPRSVPESPIPPPPVDGNSIIEINSSKKIYDLSESIRKSNDKDMEYIFLPDGPFPNNHNSETLNSKKNLWKTLIEKQRKIDPDVLQMMETYIPLKCETYKELLDLYREKNLISVGGKRRTRKAKRSKKFPRNFRRTATK
jgi:hypothetical protein